MYTLNKFYRDQYGKLRTMRVTMKPYKNEALVRRKADAIRGGFVCRYGSNNIHAMGSWPL